MIRDRELIDFLEGHKEYALVVIPSGEWSAFHMDGKEKCYGKTLRECLEHLIVMHERIKGT